MTDVLVIGGGAAGMMAAIFAARAGADVTLLEHNEKLGKKIYITGKGRCNLTNDCTRDEFLAQVPRNPRFLYSALSFFAPRDMMTLLEENGCPVSVQRGRRVFPSTEKASDVTKALAGLMRKLDVHVRLNAGVRNLRTDGDAVTGAELEDGSFLPAGSVILACGGLSYPATGSTGDGYRIAETLGHMVVPPSPVLVGLETEEDWPRRRRTAEAGSEAGSDPGTAGCAPAAGFPCLGQETAGECAAGAAAGTAGGALSPAVRNSGEPFLQSGDRPAAGKTAEYAENAGTDGPRAEAAGGGCSDPRRSQRAGDRAGHDAQQKVPESFLRRRDD